MAHLLLLQHLIVHGWSLDGRAACWLLKRALLPVSVWLCGWACDGVESCALDDCPLGDGVAFVDGLVAAICVVAGAALAGGGGGF